MSGPLVPAAILAASDEREAGAPPEKPLLAFLVGGRRYAVDMARAREILRFRRPTPDGEVRRLEESLASPDEEARYAAIRTLALRDGRHALGLLLQALGDDSWRVRKEAAEALAAGGDREVVVASLVDTVAASTD